MKMNTLICSNLDIRHHKIYFKIYFLFVLRIITWKFPRFCISIQIVHAISVCTAQRAQPKYNFSHYFFVDLSLRLIPGVFQPLEFINQRISKIFFTISTIAFSLLQPLERCRRGKMRRHHLGGRSLSWATSKYPSEIHQIVPSSSKLTLFEFFYQPF